MATKKKTAKPSEIPPPGKHPVIEPVDPEEPIVTEEDPEIIPEEDPDETPPYEPPVPGEGP
jgi:hypothetical protein